MTETTAPWEKIAVLETGINMIVLSWRLRAPKPAKRGKPRLQFDFTKLRRNATEGKRDETRAVTWLQVAEKSRSQSQSMSLSQSEVRIFRSRGNATVSHLNLKKCHSQSLSVIPTVNLGAEAHVPERVSGALHHKGSGVQATVEGSCRKAMAEGLHCFGERAARIRGRGWEWCRDGKSAALALQLSLPLPFAFPYSCFSHMEHIMSNQSVPAPFSFNVWFAM